MNILRALGILYILVLINSCSSIPEKVPSLIEASADTVDNQSALLVADLEAAIIAANSSKALLVLINLYLSTIDTSTLSTEERSNINNFNNGYQIVISQLDNVLSQKQEPQKYLSRFSEISAAIRLANSYISQAVNENLRIDSAIESLYSFKIEQ